MTCWCAWGAVLKTYSGRLAGDIICGYFQKYGEFMQNDNDREGMTAAVMSERLRVVEEEVLAAAELVKSVVQI